MTSIKLEIGPRGPISQFVCPKCGSRWFELVSLGIPGTGSSRCLKCGYSLANWMYESEALSTTTGIPIIPMSTRLVCDWGCGASFPKTAEGELELIQHEVRHTIEEREEAADRRQAKEDKHYEGP